MCFILILVDSFITSISKYAHTVFGAFLFVFFSVDLYPVLFFSQECLVLKYDYMQWLIKRDFLTQHKILYLNGCILHRYM